MRLEFAFLSDFAEESGGKLHALGVGVDAVHAPAVPARHPQLTMVAQIRYSAAEAGAHRLEVRALDADGRDVMDRVEGELPFPAVDGATDGSARVLVNLVGVQFPAYGDYSFHLLVGGLELARAAVRVAPPPAAAAGGGATG